MRKINKLPRLSPLVLAVFIFLIGFILSFDTATADEGPANGLCVQDFLAGAGCTANDVRIEEMTIVDLFESCTEGTKGEFEATFDVLISADGSPNRYDIGFFIATDGGSALLDTTTAGGNSCFHGYLIPPIIDPYYDDDNNDTIPDIHNSNLLFKGWWDGDGDACGDMETNTQAIRFITTPLRVACHDEDNDGFVDIHVCTSWDNNGNTTCQNIREAIPGTPSKCSCASINFEEVPTAIMLTNFSTSSPTISGWIIPFIIITIFIGSAGVILVVNKLFSQDFQKK
jgi:hypothetical protein